MLDTLQKVAYKAFGFTISSDFDLPELAHVDIKESLVDITIKKTDLSVLWSELAEPDNYFVVKEDFVLFQIPNVAIYLIENGREIMVSPIVGAKEDQIRLFILGTCIGAVLLQRKILPLHGSAVVVDDKAYAIVGDSGAGKSTLASAFLKRGYQLLSDDVIPVTLSEENIPIVTPAYPQQKLWLESLNQFGMESKQLRPIIDREEKFAVPVAAQFSINPVPLAGIFELTKTTEDGIEIIPIHNLKRLYTLFHHTYRNILIDRLGMMEWHFSTSAKILSQIELFQIRRPISRFTAHELVDIMLTKLEKGEEII